AQSPEPLPAALEGDAGERLVAAGGVRLRPTPAAALTFDRHLAIGGRIEIDGGGTRPCVLDPRRRRTAGKAARRRRGAGPGGRGRRRAFDGCGRASHGGDPTPEHGTKKKHKPPPPAPKAHWRRLPFPRTWPGDRSGDR